MAQDRSKAKALLALAKKRKATRLDGYHCIGEFHGGIFECNHVSPWTKSGRNVDADVMIVGQDWSSYDVLASEPPNREVARLGFDRTFPTNSNLDDLLQRYFGLSRGDCYLTNLFALVKGGRASASIPMKHLVWSAREFTLEEIRIVAPRLVICLGLRTFRALSRAAEQESPRNLDQAIKSPFKRGTSTIRCAAHTGALGMNNRGRDQVRKDWRKLAIAYAEAGRS